VQLEPELGHFDTNLFLPDEGQIDNRMLLLSLQKQLERQKVKWLRGQTIDAVNGGSFEINSQSYEYDLIIDCRGTGARAQMSDLRGVRGELFRLYAPQVKLNRPVRLMHPRYQLYIAPKPGSYYVVGATEIESDDDSPVTVRSALELLSAAYSVHPGLPRRRLLSKSAVVVRPLLTIIRRSECRIS
jgi:glycine oxidase